MIANQIESEFDRQTYFVSSLKLISSNLKIGGLENDIQKNNDTNKINNYFYYCIIMMNIICQSKSASGYLTSNNVQIMFDKYHWLMVSIFI